MLAEKGKKNILPIASKITFVFYSSWKFEFLLLVSCSHHTNLLVFLALHYVYSTLHKDCINTFTTWVLYDYG